MALPRTSFSRRPLLALIVLILLLVIGYTARGIRGDDHSAKPATTTSATPLSQLPVQARQTVALIQRHGPYPYSQDGIVYQNREKHLPAEPADFYHEYTVPTPGSEDRGTRRIITGTDGRFWYTPDHYASFRLISLGS